MENYLVAIVTFAGIYALLAMGLNVSWGMTGLVNLGMAGFFALGAYASAILTVRTGAWIPLGFGLAAIVAALAGAALMGITRKLRGDYLAIITLGFSEFVRLVAANEIWLTRGSDGISGIPGPWRGELSPAQFNVLFCVIVLALVAVAYVVCERLRDSPYGRVLRAVREDDTVAAVAGKAVDRYKLQAFAIGAGIMGVAGAAYGHYTSYIAPDIFRPLITIYIFLALTAGGVGNNRGAVVGAFLVMAILEGTRFLWDVVPGLAAVQKAALREIVIGVLLIVVMRLRPEGLLPEPVPKVLDKETTR
ncbi:MAG: branched-chain amino acid ABC transporter permease [Rhodospirillales bacterium]|jgi:branched-chain amino acid transport system permease protein